MKFIQLFTRLLAIVYVCGLMIFANVNPAIASQGNSSKGMQELPNIQTKADDAVKASPYDSNTEYTSNSKSNQGLNEIQGTADFDKMKRSPNEDTAPVVKQAEKAMGKVGDKMKSAKDDTKSGVGSALDKAGDAAGFVKDKAGDIVDSLTGKAENTAKSIKNKIKS